VEGKESEAEGGVEGLEAREVDEVEVEVERYGGSEVEVEVGKGNDILGE